MPKVASWKSTKPYTKKYMKKKKRARRGPKALLPRMPNSEQKYINSSIDNISITRDGTGLFLMNGVDQGTSNSTRVGNQISMTSIAIDLAVQATIATSLRISIVYDKQPNKAIWSASDLFTAISTYFYPWSQRAPLYKDRFVVLKNFFFDINPNITSTVFQKTIKKYINLPKGTPTIFAGSGADITSITGGSVYLYIASSTGSANQCNVYGSTRIRFMDS